MNIIINYPKENNEEVVKNLSFFKAILIREYIDSKNISCEQKQEIKKKILEYLQKT